MSTVGPDPRAVAATIVFAASVLVVAMACRTHASAPPDPVAPTSEPSACTSAMLDEAAIRLVVGTATSVSGQPALVADIIARWIVRDDGVREHRPSATVSVQGGEPEYVRIGRELTIGSDRYCVVDIDFVTGSGSVTLRKIVS